MRSDETGHTVKAEAIGRASVAKNSRATPKINVLFLSKRPEWALRESL
jgi:hypothetical protein